MKLINKISILVLALGLSQTSCENYLDVNDDPNNPTSENVPANLILTGAQTESFRVQTGTMNRLGNAYMNMWGPNINSFTGGFADEFSLSISNTFYSGIWSGLYLRTYPFQKIIDADGTQYNNHKAIAKIMKSHYMQYIVDLYGDAPYSQAHLGGDNLAPAYDDDQAIYRDLITQLDDAVLLINDNLGSAVGSEDVVFNGDMNMWIKFANTLKLRVLLREATLAETDAASATYLNDQFALMTTAEFLGVGESVTINPGYSSGETAQQNPFYSTYGFDVDGNATSSNNFIRASEHAIEFLNGGANGVGDPRLGSIYSQNNAGNYVGILQGSEDNGGVDLSPLGGGLLVSDSQDGYIMTSAEALFLQAEATERGYLTTGVAKDFFEAGIAESFTILGAGDPTGYLAAANPTNGIGWDGSADKIEAIMTQKWIALNGIHAIESWIDYTRTGYPVTPLATTALFPNLPNRLMYPSSELSGNAANVPAQTQADAFSTRIFWDAN